jgi:O-6-methylguanine DNA methyltransferase
MLRGEPDELNAVQLDMQGIAPFQQRVYHAARDIPRGQTLSYGEIATRIGSPGAARAVGQALGQNPFALIIPCHRVLAANGKPGGFSAAGGIHTKFRILRMERDRTFELNKAVEYLRAADAKLAALMDAIGPCQLKPSASWTVFTALARAIVFQQLHGKAASSIFERLCALFPEGLCAEAVLTASDETLLSAGLSRAKLLSIRDLADKTSQGLLPDVTELQQLDDEAIIERLTQVRGIGRWTVEMMLIFNLGRPDVLALDDYGLRKGFAAAFRKRELPSKQELAKRGEKWTPYRSVASWYLWRAADQNG